MIVFFGLLGAFFFLVLGVGYLLSGPSYKGPVSDHFNGKRFRNPSGIPANGFGDVFKYARTRKPDPVRFEKDAFIRKEPLSESPTDNDINIVFVNHSTFLIQWNGLNILTDPIWSRRCSPFQFAGPGRVRLPGIKYDELPKIDLVLISHNHYDHLDVQTVKNITRDHDPVFITSLGVDLFLKKIGVKKVFALDWWESRLELDHKITAVPANHFSSRGIFDRDTTLWSGFVLEKNGKKIYFVGDTGYSDVFKQIGEKFNGFDLSLIPIGAYHPVWFMGPIHVNPDQAIQLHLDVKSKQSVAMHFGTFPLADDNEERSTRDFNKAMQDHHIDNDSFIIPEEGLDRLKTNTIHIISIINMYI